MSRHLVRFGIIALTSALALSVPLTVQAAPPRPAGHPAGGGGGGHPGGGGGGGHPGGGGGAPHISAPAAHFSAPAAHVSAPAAHFNAPAARFNAGPAARSAPHFTGRSAPHINAGNAGSTNSRAAGRPNFRANQSLAAHGTPNNTVNRRGAVNSSRNGTFTARPNANVQSNTLQSNALRSNAVRSNAARNVHSAAVRNTLNSRAFAGALHNTNALRNPNTRAQITASAATAGWHNGRGGGGGWWRHRNGGYGWVGPVYWPFAYYDMYDYAMWGNGYDDSFWGYGYGDIYAGMFAPYGYDDLDGYAPDYASANPGDLQQAIRGGSRQAAPRSGTQTGTPNGVSSQLAPLCGEDSRNIAGLPIDQIQQALQPDDAQRAALDDLANASTKAAQDIKAACPTTIALTAPNRIANMQQRIEAMAAAVETVQPSLDKFYGLLNDEQKARLTALGQDQRQAAAKPQGSSAQGTTDQACGVDQAGVTAWPTAQIESTLHPTQAQSASLAALQDATAKAADMLKTSCQTDNALTPPARLTAVGKRLDTMLQAVKTVRGALDNFYASLTDEQKAQFEAIGPQRTAQLEPGTAEPSGQPTVRQSRSSGRRHYGAYGIGNVVRHLLGSF